MAEPAWLWYSQGTKYEREREGERGELYLHSLLRGLLCRSELWTMNSASFWRNEEATVLVSGRALSHSLLRGSFFRSELWNMKGTESCLGKNFISLLVTRVWNLSRSDEMKRLASCVNSIVEQSSWVISLSAQWNMITRRRNWAFDLITTRLQNQISNTKAFGFR